jgi:hypothetical protein
MAKIPVEPRDDIQSILDQGPEQLLPAMEGLLSLVMLLNCSAEVLAELA